MCKIKLNQLIEYTNYKSIFTIITRTLNVHNKIVQFVGMVHIHFKQQTFAMSVRTYTYVHLNTGEKNVVQ